MYTKTMSIIIPGVKNNLSSVVSNVLSGAGNCVVDIVGNFIKLVYVSTGVINNLPCAFVYSFGTINGVIKCSILTSGITGDNVGNNIIIWILTP